MNNMLRFLFICLFHLLIITPATAQYGNKIIPAAKGIRNVSSGVRTASRLPQTATATTVSAQRLAASIQATQAVTQLAAPFRSQLIPPKSLTLQTLSPLPTVPQIHPSAVANALSADDTADWARRLITPDTTPEVATMLRSLAKHWNRIRTSGTQFTEEQQARINEAEQYFFNLTPEQANDIRTISSVPFRQHAMVLRSPAATEFGYFFTGSGLLHEHESMHHFNASGYIPVYVGEPQNGLTGWNMRQLLPSPAKTDRPIFVLLDIHGGINSLEQFHVGPNPVLRISTNEIIRAMQELRHVTGTPELNLFVDACCAGAFLDEFESLSLHQRQGINVFVPTGAGQCTYISSTAQYRTHTPGKNIAKELTEKMIEQIINGQIMAQANIAGQSFNPLELAIRKANELGDYHLANLLGRTFNLQKTKRHAPGSSRSADESIRYFIARVAYEEGTARYGTLFEGSDWFKNALQTLKDDYAARYNIAAEDWFLEERFFDGRFHHKPLQ